MTDVDPPWLTPQVKALFADPRWGHISNIVDLDDWDHDVAGGTDPRLFVQAVLAMHQVQSAEKQGAAIARATWALVIATVGLVVATVVLVIVTVQNGA